MKKLFVIIFLINICLCAGAQWTPAIDMNDTLHRNMNHTVVIEYFNK